MNRSALLLLAPVLLSASACQTLPTFAPVTVPTTVAEATAVSDKVVLGGSQALIVAHNAYQGAAAAAEAAVKAGLIQGENLDRLAILNTRAVTLLQTADSGQSVALRSAEVFNIVAEIRTLIGR